MDRQGCPPQAGAGGAGVLRMHSAQDKRFEDRRQGRILARLGAAVKGVRRGAAPVVVPAAASIPLCVNRLR